MVIGVKMNRGLFNSFQKRRDLHSYCVHLCFVGCKMEMSKTRYSLVQTLLGAKQTWHTVVGRGSGSVELVKSSWKTLYSVSCQQCASYCTFGCFTSSASAHWCILQLQLPTPSSCNCYISRTSRGICLHLRWGHVYHLTGYRNMFTDVVLCPSTVELQSCYNSYPLPGGHHTLPVPPHGWYR